MRVRMTIQIGGSRNGEYWPAPGDTIDVPDHEAADLIANKYAELADVDQEVVPDAKPVKQRRSRKGAADAGTDPGTSDPGTGPEAGDPGDPAGTGDPGEPDETVEPPAASDAPSPDPAAVASDAVVVDSPLAAADPGADQAGEPDAAAGPDAAPPVIIEPADDPTAAPRSVDPLPAPTAAS